VLLARTLYFREQSVGRFIQPSVSTYRVEVTYEFARGLVNFLASELVQPFAGEIINSVCPNVGDVLSVAVEYFSVHQITSSLADRRGLVGILPAL
jgi:hypothetical protein